MIAPMSYARAIQVAERGARTVPERVAALAALRQMARTFAGLGLGSTAAHIRRQARQVERGLRI